MAVGVRGGGAVPMEEWWRSGVAVRRALDASLRGDVNTLRRLLDAGVAVDCHDDDDVTPLQCAAAAGRLNLANLLIERGADIELCNHVGLTPILNACANGHLTLFDRLMERGANPNTYTYLGLDALTLAARGGHLEMVKALLQRGICSVDPPPSSDSALVVLPTPLTIAILNGHESTARLLVASGARVNDDDWHRNGALAVAVSYGTPAVVEMLLENGAKLHGTNEKEAARQRGRTDIEELLEAKGRQIVAEQMPTTSAANAADAAVGILEAVKMCDTRRVKELLAQDGAAAADFVDAADGATPLIYAASAGRLDYVTALLKHGASIDRADHFCGWTALMHALSAGCVSVAKYLILFGADTNIRSFDGLTGFDLAASLEESDRELLTLLAQRTVDSEVTNSGDVTTRLGSSHRSRFAFSDGCCNCGLVRKVVKRWNLLRLRRRTTSGGGVRQRQRLNDGGVVGDGVGGHRRRRSFVMSNLFSSSAGAMSDPFHSLNCPSGLFMHCQQLIDSQPSKKALCSLTPRKCMLGVVERNASADLASSSLSSIEPSVLSSSLGAVSTFRRVQLSDFSRSDCLATVNAQLMGDGKVKRLRPLPKVAQFTDEDLRSLSVSSSLRRGAGPAENSSCGGGSSMNLPSTLGARRPSPGGRYLQPLGPPRGGDTPRHRVPRPHSYHYDAMALEAASAGGQSGSWRSAMIGGLGTVPRRRTPRPNSYHDGGPMLSPGGASEQPLTPTRKSFNFFSVAANAAAASSNYANQMNKLNHRFSSSPVLNGGSPGQSMVQQQQHHYPTPSYTPQYASSRFASTLPLRLPSNDFPDISEEEVQRILKELSLQEYCTVFEEQEVDMETFLTLTDADLRELGIEEAAPRNRLLAKARHINARLQCSKAKRQQQRTAANTRHTYHYY